MADFLIAIGLAALVILGVVDHIEQVREQHKWEMHHEA